MCPNPSACYSKTLDSETLDSETSDCCPEPSSQQVLAPPERFDCLYKASILVVDSNPDSKLLLRYLFEMYDANLVFAHTMEEALDAIEKVRPKLVISEILLSEGDGYTLARSINTYARTHQRIIPLIALTVCARSEDRQRALDAGFCEHISKPFMLGHLLALAANLVQP